jgi:hypothetical protein
MWNEAEAIFKKVVSHRTRFYEESKETLGINLVQLFLLSGVETKVQKGHRAGQWQSATEPESPCSQNSAVFLLHAGDRQTDRHTYKKE